MKALFEGDPIDLEIDDEVSMSTAPIQKYLKLEREPRKGSKSAQL